MNQEEIEKIQAFISNFEKEMSKAFSELANAISKLLEAFEKVDWESIRKEIEDADKRSS